MKQCQNQAFERQSRSAEKNTGTAKSVSEIPEKTNPHFQHKKLCRVRRKTLEELNKIDNTNYKKITKSNRISLLF